MELVRDKKKKNNDGRYLGEAMTEMTARARGLSISSELPCEEEGEARFETEEE